MGARTLLLAAAVSTAFFGVSQAPACGQEAGVAAAEVEISKYQFEGVVNGSAVYVRSGPGENHYPTMKLEKGSAVTVVGMKFDWLKIVPPEGSFSFVAKAFVTRGEGSQGIVTADVLNVRAGSVLTPLKTEAQCKLKKGETVTIIGEQDDYYQIRPPAGAYLFVHQKFADPVRQLDTGEGGLRAAAVDTIRSTGPTGGIGAGPAQAGDAPTTQRAEAERAELAAAEAVQAETAVAEHERLEAALNEAEAMLLESQPLTELLAGYQALLKSSQLPVSMRRTAELRVEVLGHQARAQQDLLLSQKQQAEADARLAGLRAERERLQERINGGIAVYTAVGMLAPSTLQTGSGALYRLTDPGTGRTLCYVRSGSADFTNMMGKFVGIKGEVVNDRELTLRSVVATEVAAVEADRVNNGITAQIVPPSLVGRVRETSASTGSN